VSESEDEGEIRDDPPAPSGSGGRGARRQPGASTRDAEDDDGALWF